MRIAIDIMGGDFAPKMNVEGAILAAKELKDVELILVGDENQAKPYLKENLPNIQLFHTSEIITAHDDPVSSVRRKKKSSLVIAGNLIREGKADAMVSAGNTGALVAMGILIIGRLQEIERPALAQLIPTYDGNDVLILDLGANIDAKPENLIQYAKMGSLYVNKMKGVTNPKIGLLNVGTEKGKGNELIRTTFNMLLKEEINFIGNVEARDVLKGHCDVIICDAFSGNILLKSFEGVIETFFSLLKEQVNKNMITKIAMLTLLPTLRDFKKKMDYREFGGAPLLGINGVCIKSHGSSNSTAIKNAIIQAQKLVVNNYINFIK
ncbi:phosphate acyltransferase PlsX [Paenibacillus alba]|uniref:phosphate acyltransferase PlsX n=1 Tax=Paenibacillus alba TaxID=1197127 RepID=UPI001563FE62|nr:phosphate acyltransferase PlsX [Paenibacillus alba]NQX71558.1 phosphate acyltransferase PlsX [Paenibacillus alba]